MASPYRTENLRQRHITSPRQVAPGDDVAPSPSNHYLTRSRRKLAQFRPTRSSSFWSRILRQRLCPNVSYLIGWSALCILVILRLRRNSISTTRILAQISHYVSSNALYLNCSCLSCNASLSACSGLWYGDVPQSKWNAPLSIEQRIILVISHCKSDLTWLVNFTAGYRIYHVDIISKCGYEVIGAPKHSTIIRLPNVGRCDHSYAWWISTQLRNASHALSDKDVIFFLKDDLSGANVHQAGHWKALPQLLATVEQYSFVCMMSNDAYNIRLCDSRHDKESGMCTGNFLSLSVFHDKDTLMGFGMAEYERNIKGYNNDATDFKSKYDNISHWLSSIGSNRASSSSYVNITSSIIPVCYGGAFAVSWNQIVQRQPLELWPAIESSLTRGNSIEEGHFCERCWAALLTPPLPPHVLFAIKKTSDGIYISDTDYRGALARSQKLYIHVGPPDNDAFAFRHLLNQFRHKLLLDGYHFFYKDTVIENIPTCIAYNNNIRDINLKEQDGESIESRCDSYTFISDVYGHISSKLASGYDLIISDEKFSTPGMAKELNQLFNVLDIHIVIFYYRYYDWLWKIFLLYRENGSIPESERRKSGTYASIFYVFPNNHQFYRSIDFLRYICKWQLQRKQLGLLILNSRNQTRGTSTSSTSLHDIFRKETLFEPKIHFADNLVHPAFIAEQYHLIRKFQGKIHIINVYASEPVTTLVCDVLQYAPNSCSSMNDFNSNRLRNANGANRAFGVSGFDVKKDRLTYIWYEDIIISYWLYYDHINDGIEIGGVNFTKQVQKWVHIMKSRMESRYMSTQDLPRECLRDNEINILLEESQKYEKMLLPDFYSSSDGETSLEEDFYKQTSRWCSVKTDDLLDNPRWAFLFNPPSKDEGKYSYQNLSDK